MENNMMNNEVTNEVVKNVSKKVVSLSGKEAALAAGVIGIAGGLIGKFVVAPLGKKLVTLNEKRKTRKYIDATKHDDDVVDVDPDDEFEEE